MSVDNDEQKQQIESADAQIDVSQLTDAGALEAEAETQEADDSEQMQISIDDLAGTQPEEDKAEKERNRLYAENRVAKKRLKELQAQVETGTIPESFAFKPKEKLVKPKLADYVNDDRLYSEFNGSETLALAAYNEAKEEWSARSGDVDVARARHAESVKAQLAAQIAAEEAFEGSIIKHRKTVKGIDDALERAEKLLGESDFNAIRDIVGGENSALVLATIGSNSKVQSEFMETAQRAVASGNPAILIKHLALLEQKVVSNLPSAKTISTAASESPVNGGNAGMSDLDVKIDKAAKAGNTDEYRRLMAIKRAARA